MIQQAEYLELCFWLRLVLTPSVGAKTARKLLSAFGSAPSIFEQSFHTLTQIVSQKQAQALLRPPEQFEKSCQTMEQWLQADPLHHAIPLGHPHYPAKLLQTTDPPLLLYASGDIHLLNCPAISMVGSRQPTPQGVETAKDFAKTLAQQGLTVVSGLALGIDGASQSAAVEEAGSTIAVLGTGIDRVYPASQHALAHRIAKHGLLLSDYPLGTPPIAQNFPKRNRIIAGLALGTLVVEATLRSGSLITAKLAAEIGREVFAIPGSIHSPQAKGCHWLIRQGAKLVETAQDIIEELQLPVSKALITQTASPPKEETCDKTDDAILQAIGEGPTSFEAIANRTSLDTPSLQAQLLTLELTQQIARLPGGLFQRLHSSQ